MFQIVLTQANAHGDQIMELLLVLINGWNYGSCSSCRFHISEFYFKKVQTYYPDHWANATDSVLRLRAVALNMSWGSNLYDAEDIQNYMSNNSVDAATAVAYYLTYGRITANATSVNTWVTAMNNFQTAGGVIIQSLANATYLSPFTALDDADFVAAMPVYFSQLTKLGLLQ